MPPYLERAEAIYGREGVAAQAARIAALEERARALGVREGVLVSVPGRTELGGNHTDHNRGRVLAASVDLDTLGIVEASGGGEVEIESAGHGAFRLSLASLEPKRDEEGSPAALVRGVVSWFAEAGRPIGGFRAAVHSRVLPGSGLSSSASFEVFVGQALSALYAGNAVPFVDLAIAGQRAENRFFGKPSGLMDQVACAAGGAVAIDFADPAAPAIERIAFDLAARGYALAVVDTKGSHADLTPDYASIPEEMRAVARCLGKSFLREVSEAELLAALPAIRAKAGDRALARALHFLDEDRRAARMADSLRAGDFGAYLDLVRESGSSSWRLLQNVFSPSRPADQPLTVALALSERVLGKSGAVRVHGGGFAGTIQAYVPLDAFDKYRAALEPVFGEGSVMKLSIRALGATAV